MRRMQVIAIMISMAWAGSYSNLHAQCGSPHGALIYCCGTQVYVGDEWGFGGMEREGQVAIPCAEYDATDCANYGVTAGGSCVNSSLSTPAMVRQLDAISRQMPLLVASCAGGFVPYQPHGDKVPDDRPFILRSPKLRLTDLTGNGE